MYQAPVMNLTDADLAVVQRSGGSGASQSSIGISPHKPRAEKINTVAARIWDQAANYLETPLTPYRSDALVAADGAELSQEVKMPAVFYGGQAFHISGIMLRDGRDPLTVTLPFKMRAYPLELFDGVTLTLSRYGWANKEFRILSRTFMPDGYVMLTLKETTAAIFQYGAAFQPEGVAPNTGLPKPWEIYPPVLAEISSGEGELIVQTDGTVVNSIRVTWAPVLEASVASSGTVEIQFLVLPDGDWRSAVVPGDATEARLTGVADLAFVIIRARTRSTLAASDWSPQVIHQVVGKTEPPPNIENLSISGSVLSWSLPRRVPDLAGFIFRFHYGNNLDWGSAAPLHTGLITESPYDLVARPGGVVTIMGKAIDTTGNLSLATGNIVMDLGDSPIANIVEQWDFRALGWPTSPDGGLLAAGRYAQYTIANIFSSERATTATYVAGGVFQTAAVDEPRFENGQLLIEGQATNLLRYSQDLTGAGWIGACAVNAAAESYRGIAFAEVAKTTTGSSEVRGQNFGAVTAGQTCVATVAVLAGTKTSAMIGLYSTAETWGAAGSGSAEILEGPGAISLFAGGSAFNFTGLSTTVPTLIRITRTYVSASTGALYIYPGSANAAPVGDSMKVAYTQVEVGATPTSYIPTTTTPVTRAADNVYVSESQYGYTKSGGDLAANALDSLYGTDDQSFFGADLDPFYEAGSYGQMVYVTNEVPVSKALAGSIMTLATVMQGVDLHIDYRLSGPGSLYGTGNDPFYGPDAAPFYDGPGAWMPWPGQLIVQNEVYQFRVTIGAGVDRGILQQMVLTVDAPDMEEQVDDLLVGVGGTLIPYTKPFTVIKNIQITLQANASNATSAETTKSPNLAPKVTAYNAAHASVGGATVDATLKGY
ncbi:hypothetical protein CKY39_19530 [Variovorax boronicumulans]|uniref:Fibronectin type-III domain-containing protein n=2 Tax=Variovorax boronicumulans TaxID=436515 RepID=A0A250DLA6_9BURK|nr:hypothetical protein CKY39_19530 [Variovorax boronicumulans]